MSTDRFTCLPLIVLFYLLSAFNMAAQVPKTGNGDLEIANWNIEWFGKTGNNFGPDDEALQQANVLSVIQHADIDIWTFCEVSNVSVFNTMMAQLPDYGYTICNYSQEQKTAVIYKKAQFQLVKSQLLAVNNPDSFSTGRYPFLVVLKPLAPMDIDTLFLIAIHLKANVGNGSELMDAYNSRVRSAEWIKMYLNNNHTNHACMVLGDWNDDLDESVYNHLASPYNNLQAGDFTFTFTTRKFTDSHQGTTTAYTNAIDHQLISSALKNKWVQSSTSIFRLDQYINNYSTTTSDHYPVYSVFKRYNLSVNPLPATPVLSIYPNPAGNSITLCSDQNEDLVTLKISDMYGKCVMTQQCRSNATIDIATLPDGCYQVTVTGEAHTCSQVLQVMH